MQSEPLLESKGWPVLSGISVGMIAASVFAICWWPTPDGSTLWKLVALGACLGGLWGFLRQMEPSTGPWVDWIARIERVAILGYVLLHAWLILLQAIPSPGGGMMKKDWQNETVQSEFIAWTARLNGVGIQVTKEDLETGLWTLASHYMSVRREGLRPFYPYYRNTGTWQSWRMFVAPHRYPSRLHISVKQNGEWSPLYIARSPDKRWHAYQLDHDRFRAALFRYGWGNKYPRQWKGFGDWIWREAKVEFAELEALELKFWSYRTLSPEEVRQGEPEEGEWHRRRVIRRKEK